MIRQEDLNDKEDDADKISTDWYEQSGNYNNNPQVNNANPCITFLDLIRQFLAVTF